MPESGGEAEAFCEAGGIDVHDHVHQRFDFGSASGASDEAAVDAEILDEFLHRLIGGLVAADHEVELSFPGLADAGGHAGFKRTCAGLLRGGMNLAMNAGCDGGAVDESFSLRSDEEVVAAFEEDFPHGVIIGDDGENDVCSGGDGRE